MLPKSLQLLLRIPDLADSEAAARIESDVVGKAVRWPLATRVLQPLDALVVLFARHARCRGEPREDASVRRSGGDVDGLLRMEVPLTEPSFCEPNEESESEDRSSRLAPFSARPAPERRHPFPVVVELLRSRPSGAGAR